MPSTRVHGASFRTALTGISIFALAIRISYVELFSNHLQVGLDSIWYQLVAATLGAGDGYVDPVKYLDDHVAVPTAFRPPGYPVFLALVGKIADGSTHTFRIAGCVAGVVTVVLVGFLGRRVGGDAVGLVAAAIASIYPTFLAVDAAVMSETVYVPLVTGCVVAVYLAIERPTMARWALVGVLLGSAVLTRPDAVVLIVVLAVPAIWLATPVPLERRARLAATAVAMCALVVVPWMARNERQVGAGTVATLTTGTAIAGSNCPATYYGDLIGSWSFECTLRANAAEIDEAALDAQLRKDGRRYLVNHAERLVVVIPVRILRQWGLFDPLGEARLEAVESRNTTWQMISWASYLPVAALAAYGIFLLRRRRVVVLPMVAVLLGTTVTAALVYGNQRLRTSADPVLVVAAAAAVVHLAQRWRPVPPTTS